MVHIGDTGVTDVMRFGTAETNPLKTATIRNVSLRIGTRNVCVRSTHLICSTSTLNRGNS